MNTTTVRLRADMANPQWQPRQGTLKGLHLAFSSQQSTRALSGGALGCQENHSGATVVALIDGG